MQYLTGHCSFVTVMSQGNRVTRNRVMAVGKNLMCSVYSIETIFQLYFLNGQKWLSR